jgi:hypothetical protein
MIALATFNVTVQMAAPRWVAARALALYQTFLLGGMAVGSILFGLIGDQWGVSSALLLAAAMQVCSVLVGIRFALPQVEDLDLGPLEEWVEPRVEVQPRSGPIMISIEYRVREANVDTFLKAINERRRIHRRDGARHWALARDLAEREVWVESYRFPTWLDYVRHNHRRTHEDAESWNWVRAVHEGPKPPRVRRCVAASSLAADPRNSAIRELHFPASDPTHSA